MILPGFISQTAAQSQHLGKSAGPVCPVSSLEQLRDRSTWANPPVRFARFHLSNSCAIAAQRRDTACQHLPLLSFRGFFGLGPRFRCTPRSSSRSHWQRLRARARRTFFSFWPMIWGAPTSASRAWGRRRARCRRRTSTRSRRRAPCSRAITCTSFAARRERRFRRDVRRST